MKNWRNMIRLTALMVAVIVLGASAAAETVSLPAQLERIEEQAFADCESLEGVLIVPLGVDVDETAFSGSSLDIVRGVAVVGDASEPTAGTLNGDVWSAVSPYCQSKGLPCRYTTDAAGAISDGYDIVITVGFMADDPMASLHSAHPNVRFICLDSDETNLGTNVYTVSYNCGQAGFMAGYAAVKMGYESLGFMGGMAVPDVVSYGQGFMQGANQAAVEKGNVGRVTLAYTYTGVFWPTPEVYQTAADWYDAGVEIIFCAGGNQATSVNDAAADKGGKMIGVDANERALLSTVQYSAIKNLGFTATDALGQILAGQWSAIAGTHATKGLVSNTPANNHVGLAPASPYDAEVIARLRNHTYPSGDIQINVTDEPTAPAQITIATSAELSGLGTPLTGVIHIVPTELVVLDEEVVLEGELRVETGDNFFNSLSIENTGSLTLADGATLGTYNGFNATGFALAQVWVNGGELDASHGTIAPGSTLFVSGGTFTLSAAAAEAFDVTGGAATEALLRQYAADDRFDGLMIQGSMALTQDLTLPVNTRINDNAAVTVGAGCTLTIPDGVTLTVGGGCSLTIDGGTIVGNVQVEDGGTYTPGT